MVFKGSYQQYDSKTMAKVVGTFLPISPKDSREIAKTIKGKSVESAINYLQSVVDGKLAVPFKRFNRDVPHRRGKIAAGRFPRKAGEHIIKLLKHLKANASDKELDADNLQIVHVAAQRGPVLWHYGRIRGRRRKCTYFEAVAKEIEKKEKPKKKEEKKEEKKEVKVEEKPVEKKEEKPEVKKEEKPVEKKPEVKKEEKKVKKPKEKKPKIKKKTKPKKKPAKKKVKKK